MRISINGRFLTQPVTGVQRFAREFVVALDALLEADEAIRGTADVSIVAPRGVKDAPALKNIPLRVVGMLAGHAWEQLELPLYAKGSVLVNLGNSAPLFAATQLVTIHDAAVDAVPQAYGLLYRMWYQILMRCAGRLARKVLTVSEFSKREITERFGIPPTRVQVVTEGCEHMTRLKPDSSILERHGLQQDRYVLAVGSLSEHKNFSVVVDAMDRIKDPAFDYVIAGGVDPRVFSGQRRAVSRKAKHVGYVTDAELKALYVGATCFVFASLYEGFGLPALEAMACGCPLVASTAGALPEVCGDAAIYFDPLDPAELAAKIELIMSDASLRRKLRDAGIRRATGFSWTTTARMILSNATEVGNRSSTV